MGEEGDGHGDSQVLSLDHLHSQPRFAFAMKISLILLASLLASVSAIPKGGNALTCAICIDLVTDIDEFLTSDTTEDQIVQFVEQLCKALGTILPDFEATCNALVESQLPAIIDGLVNDNLNPQEICTQIAACP